RRPSAHQDRRVRPGRAQGGRGRRRRVAAEVEEAPEAHGVARPGAAHGGRRDRRALCAGGPGGQEGRHRGQPRAGEADGRRVGRHGAGRVDRGHAVGSLARPRPSARSEGHVTRRAAGPPLTPDEYVDAIVQIAERDASIGRVLREILSLDGVVTIFFFRRGLPHAAYLVGYLLLLWLVFALLVAIRQPLADSGRRAGRFVIHAADYTIQTLYHGLLLFVLPAYYASTTLTSVNVFFFLLLVAMALLVTFDPWYRVTVQPRPWLGYTFFVVSIFAVLNVALPLVGVPPYIGLLVSAFAASLSVTPVVRRARRRRWRGALR